MFLLLWVKFTLSGITLGIITEGKITKGQNIPKWNTNNKVIQKLHRDCTGLDCPAQKHPMQNNPG